MEETFDEMKIEAAAAAMFEVMTGHFTVSPVTRAAIMRRLAEMFEAAVDAPANEAHPLQVVPNLSP